MKLISLKMISIKSIESFFSSILTYYDRGSREVSTYIQENVDADPMSYCLINRSDSIAWASIYLNY